MGAYLYGPSSLLVLAYGYFQFVVSIAYHHLGQAGLGVHIALLVVPELALIYGTVLEEGYRPVASLVVAPIGGEKLLPALLHGLDAFDPEGILASVFDEVNGPGALWQGREVECDVEPGVAVGLDGLAELCAFNGQCGMTLAVGLEVYLLVEP